MFLEMEEQINFIGAKSSGLKLVTGVVIISFVIMYREPKLELNKVNKNNCALQSFT